MTTLKDVLLCEGGNAVPDVVRINQRNVQHTVEWVYHQILAKTGISRSDMAVVGSAGKKDPAKNGELAGSSGDIDIAVSCGDIGVSTILTRIADVAARQQIAYKVLIGLGILSLRIPIVASDDMQNGQYCQVDIMPVESLSWVQWSYYSPSFTESQYSGLYRNEVIFAIAGAMCNVTRSDDHGNPVEWSRCFYDLNRGLMAGVQTRMGKRGVPIKTVKTLAGKMLMTNNPIVAAQLLFGEGTTPDSVLTWESVFTRITDSNFIHRDVLPQIITRLKTGLEKKRCDIPPELENLLF